MAVWIPASASVNTSGLQSRRHVLARHQLLPALQQQEEDFHGLPRQPHARSALPHLVGDRVDLELAESVGHGGPGHSLTRAASLYPHPARFQILSRRHQWPASRRWRESGHPSSKEITHAFSHSVPSHYSDRQLPASRPCWRRPWSSPAALAQDQPGNRHWVATWAVSPQRSPAPLGSTARPCGRSYTSAWEENHTSPALQCVRHESAGDWRCSCSPQRRKRTIAPGPIVLTFGGLPTITIPAGAVAVSDPVALAVPESRRRGREPVRAGRGRGDDLP